jgi:hypothetical protein
MATDVFVTSVFIVKIPVRQWIRSSRSEHELVTLSAAGLTLGAAGVIVQAAAGADLPRPIPPGVVILTVAAVLVVAVRRRWMPIGISAVAVLSLLNVDDRGGDSLLGGAGIGTAVGKWMLLIGAISALLGALAMLAQARRRTRESAGTIAGSSMTAAGQDSGRELPWPRRLLAFRSSVPAEDEQVASAAAAGPDKPQRPGEPRGRWRGWVPVLALLVLAPWTAECSWGGFAVGDFPLVILFLGPLYGSAAVLIREVSRRTGGGWPVMVLLAGAFGVVQAGLVDQALFNSDFLDDTEYADLAQASTATLVPAFGFSADQAITYLGNHVLLSICAPIMLVESAVRAPYRHRPWLGRRGLLGLGVLYLLGSLMIFSDHEAGRKGFVLGPAQAGLAVAVVIVLVGAAMLPRWRRTPPRRAGFVPHPLLFGLLLLAIHLSLWFVSGWPGVGVRVVAIVCVVALVATWSRRAGWMQRHVAAGWSASLVAVAAGAFLVPAYQPMSALIALVSDVTVGVVTLVLVIGSYRLARAADIDQAEQAVTDPRDNRNAAA